MIHRKNQTGTSLVFDIRLQWFYWCCIMNPSNNTDGAIRDYLKAKPGSCRVYPTPFAVKLNLYANAGVREYWIVDPAKESIFVYYLEQEHFKAEAHTFQDKIKVNIYDDLYIDFSSLDL